MLIRSTFVIFSILILSAGNLCAATYHVATNASGASDNNDGLNATVNDNQSGPWKTLSKAAATATAGDTVLIYSGDYRSEDTGWGKGFINIVNSGDSAAAPITFKAAMDNQPIVNTLLVHEKRWITIDGLTFINPDFDLPATWRDMPEIVVDNDVPIDFSVDWETREASVRQRFSTYMSIRDELLGVYSNGIDIKSSQHITVKNNFIQRYAFGIQVRSNSSNILIEHNDISYCHDGIFTWQPAPAITDSIIRHNRLRQNFNNGMMVREFATNVLIENNVVHYSGTSHISVLRDSTQVTVRNNLGRYGGYYTEAMANPGSSAFNVHSSSVDNIFEGNIATDQVDLTGIDGNGFIADLMREGAGVVFRNNIALRNRGSGVRTTEAPFTKIVNNTFVDNGFGAGSDTKNGAGVQLSRDSDTDMTIANNIFYNNTPSGIKSYLLMDDQSQIENNLYYSSDGLPLIWDGYEAGDRAYYTLDAITENFGWESNGVNGDPQFIGEANSDFHLLPSSSIAIDAGRAIDGVDIDLDGSQRPNDDSVDIGAYELTSNDCPVDALSRELQDGAWALLSIPCGPLEGYTVGDVFADDLPGTLGVDWAVFQFNPSSNNYTEATSNTRLLAGSAFWIVQVSGSVQSIELPQDSKQTPRTPPDSRCMSVRGCRDINLVGDASSNNSSNWRLLGNPYAEPAGYGELTLSTSEGVCNDIDACSLMDASKSPATLVDRVLWRYDDEADTPSYTSLVPGSSINPWEGFWMSLLSPTGAPNLTLHYPAR